MELAFVNRRVAGRLNHGGGVLEARRELDLRVALGGGHVLLERVLDPVLGGEVTAQQRRAGRGAHARVAERVLERQAVSLQTRERRHVALSPAGREVLDRPLLVSDEHEHVHPGHPTARATTRPGTGLGGGRRDGAGKQHAGRRHRGGLQQIGAGDAVLINGVLARSLVTSLHFKASSLFCPRHQLYPVRGTGTPSATA